MRAADLINQYRTSINLPYKRKDLGLILGIALILLFLLAIYLGPFKGLDKLGLISLKKEKEQASLAAGLPTNTNSVIEPGSMVSGATYIVFIDGSNYYAKNGKTGEIQYSGTDAATLINTAIGALPASGGKLVLSDGTFDISAPTNPNDPWDIAIKLCSNCTLEGQGSSTILKLASNAGENRRLIGATGKSNVVLKNLVVDGNRDYQTTNTNVQVEFANITGGLIENVEVKNSDMYGIELGGGSGVIVRNSRVHNTQSHGIITSGTASDHIIEGNVVYDIGLPDTGDPPETGGRGIVVSQGDRIVIANNNVYDINDDNGINLRMARYSTVVGNYATGDSGISIVTEAGDTIEAVGNTITGNTAGGFRKNNIVGYVGIQLLRGGDGTGPAIHDNTIVGNTIATTGRGGILIQGTSNNLVEDNVIYDTDHDAPGGPMGGWGGAAILVGKSADKVSDGNLVQGNKIRNDPGHYQDFGIWIEAGCSGNVVRYNDISGMIQATIRNDGTGTIIQENKGYATENSGTATIASGSFSKTFAHGLAAVPSVVAVTPQGNPGSSGIWVSAKDGTNITVNRSGTSGDLTFSWQAEVK